MTLDTFVPNESSFLMRPMFDAVEMKNVAMQPVTIRKKPLGFDWFYENVR